MLQRNLRKPLLVAARHYPVITVTGPWQSGKTTLVRATFPRHEYVNLEEPDQRSFAREDPRGFLAQFPGKVILDEVQHVPELLSYVQSQVDTASSPGRFVLTGSQNLLLMQTVSQSLAGRTAVLHLLPLSLSELHERKSLPLETLGQKPSDPQRVLQSSLQETLWRGFYPRIHSSRVQAHDWLQNYYRTYIERDVRSTINVGDLETFSRFVRLCAGRAGQLVNTVALGNDCGITHTTVRRWLSVLETTFIIHLLRPYHTNFSKRLIKAPKLHFIDTGLLCYLLGVPSANALVSHASRGAVFESFVVSEMLKAHWHAGLTPQLYFWRDSGGNEVDLIVETGESTVALELKSAETIATDFYKGLLYWRELRGNTGRVGLIYGGKKSFIRHNIPTYSWSAL